MAVLLGLWYGCTMGVLGLQNGCAMSLLGLWYECAEGDPGRGGQQGTRPRAAGQLRGPASRGLGCAIHVLGLWYRCAMMY
eukprot:1426451-Pyramimonas_sp.AAC.2